MGSRYLDMIRGQRPHKGGGEFFTAKSVLGVLAVVAMCGSAVYWWGVQSELTDNVMMALAFTAILVLAPPVLTSFLIPWSPGGMLLQKINAKTWGYVVIIIAALYLLYYSFEIQYSWWATQQVVVNTGLIWQQVLIGIIGFIIIPALLWTPVTSEELVEQVRQAHLVKRYELQTQADIAILRETLLRAQEKALIGFANLTVNERTELAETMRHLVTGIDSTLKDIGQSVKTVSGATIPFSSLEDNDDIREYLDYIHQNLTNNEFPELVQRLEQQQQQHYSMQPYQQNPNDQYYYEDSHEEYDYSHAPRRGDYNETDDSDYYPSAPSANDNRRPPLNAPNHRTLASSNVPANRRREPPPDNNRRPAAPAPAMRQPQPRAIRAEGHMNNRDTFSNNE